MHSLFLAFAIGIGIKGFDTLGTLSTIFYKGDNFCDQVSFPVQKSPEKGCTLKGKNLLPWGANSFLLEWTPIQKRDKMILTELPPLKVY